MSVRQSNLKLFAPVQLGSLNLKHRVVMAPLTRSRAEQPGGIWISEGIESVVFPSATGTGRNVAVYLANAGAGGVIVRNRAEVLAALRRPHAGKRGR